jgi:hypothetical protein
MPVIAPALFTVLKRFSERKDCIKRLFRENDNFRNVCEDYQNCTEALRYWNQSESDEAPTRREEYGMLQQDLEAEILEHLNESEE